LLVWYVAVMHEIGDIFWQAAVLFVILELMLKTPLSEEQRSTFGVRQAYELTRENL
jgi:hypothetical protein